MIELFGFDLSLLQLLVLAATALLAGMAKAGIYGANIPMIPLLALLFGGRESTGILLCLLIFADFFGVAYYRQHAEWKYLKTLFPAALVGVVIGTYLGTHIGDQGFKRAIGIIILVCVVLMIWQDRQKQQTVPAWPWFAPAMGVSGGFTTMVGNLGGPVMALYLLAMRFSKQAFIGTAAWFFLMINLSKVPFHVLAWGTIDWSVLSLCLVFLPLVAIGAFFGFWLAKQFSDVFFRRLVIGVTLLSVLTLF